MRGDDVCEVRHTSAQCHGPTLLPRDTASYPLSDDPPLIYRGVTAHSSVLAHPCCRHHHTLLGPQAQATLLEVLGQASADLPPPARPRPGLGPPCPLALLKRVLPPAPALQPQKVQLLVGCGGLAPTASLGAGGAGGKSGGGGGGIPSKGFEKGGSPFIFNPNAGKRKELEQVTIPTAS